MSKQIIKSFQVPNGARDVKILTKACQRLKDEKDFQAIRENKTHREKLNHSPFTFEVIETMENARVNLYNATDGDLFQVGVNYRVFLDEQMDR